MAVTNENVIDFTALRRAVTKAGRLHGAVAVVQAVPLRVAVVETALTAECLSVRHHVHRFRLIACCSTGGGVVAITDTRNAVR